MARINNAVVYNKDIALVGTEILIGSKDVDGQTLNYELSTLKSYFQSGVVGAVNSVFGRAGEVVALETDYNSFYPLISDLVNYVDLTTNQTVGGNKTFSDVTIFNGKTIVGGTEFGPTAIGSSLFRATSADFQAINLKDNTDPAKTPMAMFATPVGGSDGYTISMLNFVDNVFVWSIGGGNAQTVYDSVGREVEATIGLRNDYIGTEFTVWDFFNQDYDAVTDIAAKMGYVAIHGGGAAAKPIGLWRYDTTTYTNIWELDIANLWTFNVDVLANSYALNALNTAPASATATGTTGEIRVDADFIYVCTATNTWKRSALVTWP